MLDCAASGDVLTRALHVAQRLSLADHSAHKANVLEGWTHLRTTLSTSSSEVASSTRDNSTELTGVIALNSDVIHAQRHPHGVLEVTMADKQAKNMFSPAFTEGMNELLAHIRSNNDYRVVVLHGYDNYFASGGTKETLLDIQKDQAKFTDNTVFQWAVDCPLLGLFQPCKATVLAQVGY